MLMKKRPAGKNYLQPTFFIPGGTLFHFRAALPAGNGVRATEKNGRHQVFLTTTKKAPEAPGKIPDTSGFVCFKH